MCTEAIITLMDAMALVLRAPDTLGWSSYRLADPTDHEPTRTSCQRFPSKCSQTECANNAAGIGGRHDG